MTILVAIFSKLWPGRMNFFFSHITLNRLLSTIMSDRSSLDATSEDEKSCSPPVVPTNRTDNDLELPDQWPRDVDPDYLIMELRRLKKEVCRDQKAFFSTYRKWDLLTQKQKNKVEAFFHLQSTPVRVAVVSTARNHAKEICEAEKERSVNTSKNDRARLLHLMKYPPAIRQWTSAKIGPDREALDTGEINKPFQMLAEMFNDYENVVFQNATIEYDEENKPRNPYEPRADMESIAKFCWEINPTDSSRPERDGGWLRKVWKEMRTGLTRIRESFKRSGNHDAENEYDEWLKFAHGTNDVYIYAIAVLDWATMDQLGKALPDTVQ